MSKTAEDRIISFIVDNYPTEIDEDFITHEGAVDAAIRLLQDKQVVESNGIYDMVAKLTVKVSKLEKELTSVRAHSQNNTVGIQALDEKIGGGN